MIKSINAWSFPSSMKFADCLKLAKDAGFEAIEPSFNEAGPLSLASSAEDILSIRKAAEEAGLKISSLATGLYWKYPFTSSDSAIRDKSLHIARKQIEAAVLLGTDAILVVPGAVGVDFIAGAEVVDYDVAYDRALDAVKNLAPYAEAAKVYIGVENVWNKFLLSPLEMRDFIDKAGSPYIGAYFDVGNVIYSGYPEHWIKVLGSRIKRVHFKDYLRGAAGLSGFVDLLSGSVDYVKVMAALEKSGYNSYVTAEVSPYWQYPEQKVFNTSAAIDRILGHITQN